MAENAPGVYGVRVRVAVARRGPAPTGPPLGDPPRVSQHGRSCGMDDRDHDLCDDVIDTVMATIDRPEQHECIVLDASGVALPSGIAVTFITESGFVASEFGDRTWPSSTPGARR